MLFYEVLLDSKKMAQVRKEMSKTPDNRFNKLNRLSLMLYGGYWFYTF